MSEEAIRFLRKACRLSRRIPSEVIARKFRFNSREAVEFYSLEHNAQTISVRLQQGWRFLGTLEKILSGPPQLVNEIFKPFQFMEASAKGSIQKREIIGIMNPLGDHNRVYDLAQGNNATNSPKDSVNHELHTN